MEELFHNQQAAINALRQLWSNFKKDGQDRKTSEYVKKRIETLDAYWNEFQKTHEKLCLYEDRTHDYFIGNRYEETKAFYLEVRETIQKASLIKPTVFGRQQPGVSAAEGRSTPGSPMPTREYATRGTDSKYDEKMRKQGSNFKAFARSVANIDLSTVEEKWEFEDILKTVETRWNAIDCLHWKIDSEFDETDESYENSYTQHEQMYLNIKKEINRKLWSVSHRERSTPQLDIPLFNGNYQNWVSFKDLFTEAIHGNPYLSAAQKMQFLKSKIKGEPERLIQHLPISSDNYITCWEILNHRYNNKKLIFTTHINTLLNIPVTQQATSNHLKRIHDVTIECLNGIKNLGVDINTWDPIIVHLLALKLDPDTLNEYCSSLKQPRELPSLKEFLEFLENRFTTMESTRHKQDTLQKSTNSSSSSGNSKPNKGKQVYVSNKATSKKTPSVTCPVCKEHHGIYYCKQFRAMIPDLKRNTISQLNFCTNCMYSHHGKNCNSSKRCKKCEGIHNTLLHEAFSTSNSTSLNVSGPVMSEKESSLATNVAQEKIASTVLLATAIIKVTGSDGLTRTMRALVDQGSQVSLITENAAQQLGLRRQQCKGVITGVGMNDKMCKGMLNINCSSLDVDGAKPPSAVTTDVIQKVIGSFGKYQLWLCLLIFLSKFPIAFHQMAIIFLAPKVSYSCPSGLNNTCPCPNPTYDTSIFTRSIIMEWDLICEKRWLTSFTQTLFQLGTLLGSIFFGMASDRFGRKYPLLVAVVIQVTCGVAAAYVPKFWTFNLLRFLVGISVGGTMVIGFVIIMEFVGTQYRDIISALYQVPFNFGHMLLPVFGYFFRDYSDFQLSISVPVIILLSYFLLLPETPRWLIAVRRTEEAITVLERVAKVNKRPTENIRADIQAYQTFIEKNQLKKGNILDLFRTPNLRKNNIAMAYNWLTCSYCFYGVSQYVGQLSGNAFINVACSASVTLLGTLISIPLLKTIGRKTILIIFHLICATCLFVLAVIPEGVGSVICASIGVVASFIVFVVVYLYCTELFPTVVRNAALGFSSMAARIGSMIAPFVIELRHRALWMPPVAFAVLPFIAAGITLLLPETKGCELTTTIEEGEQMGKKTKT